MTAPLSLRHVTSAAPLPASQETSCLAHLCSRIMECFANSRNPAHVPHESEESYPIIGGLHNLYHGSDPDSVRYYVPPFGSRAFIYFSSHTAQRTAQDSEDGQGG